MRRLITKRPLQGPFYEWLNAQEHSQRPRYQAHGGDVVHATLAAGLFEVLV